MYIRTDDDHNIVALIAIGGMPETNGYEIDNIPEDIINDILGYKYIDGKFIKREPRDPMQENIGTIRSMKIEWMRSVCQDLIEKGIDVNGSHYSLGITDQLELSRLESFAKLSPLTPVFYHADGEKYRQYSAKEFLALVTKATAWITYHRTYFNLIKSEILKMDSAFDISKLNYGAPLAQENLSLLKSIMTEDVTPEIVTDDFDYESLFTKPEVEFPIELVNRMQDIEKTSPQEVISEFIKKSGDT